MTEESILKLLSATDDDVKIAHELMLVDENQTIGLFRKAGKHWGTRSLDGYDIGECWWLSGGGNSQRGKIVTVGNKIIIYSFSNHLIGVLK